MMLPCLRQIFFLDFYYMKQLFHIMHNNTTHITPHIHTNQPHGGEDARHRVERGEEDCNIINVIVKGEAGFHRICADLGCEIGEKPAYSGGIYIMCVDNGIIQQ
jgi:hypothetical protein